jgi:hypothetical protein
LHFSLAGVISCATLRFIFFELPHRTVFTDFSVAAKISFCQESSRECRRHNLSRYVLFFYTLLLIGAFGASAPAQGQVSSDRGGPAATVNTLRSGLAQEQKALVEAITGNKVPASDEYLNRLRIELRTAVMAATQTSGEVDLAVLRAAIRDRLARIDAYESAYGLQDGARTTRLNVLGTADLQTLDIRLKDTLRGLLAEAAKLPAGSVPTSLHGRIFESRAEIDAIAIERAARADGPPPKLVSIGQEPTAQNRSKALEQIRRLEIAESEQSAERALLIEVEERLAWNPNDASLKLVRSQMRTPRPRALAAVRATAWRTGWPPSRGPPPPTS